MSMYGPALVGGMVQAGLGALNNTWAQQQQEEARRQNYMYGEMAAENADARTRALYNDFYSPQALMRQYREAGLSPSMMFGGTPGQGGTSGAQGSGATGLGTPYMPMSMIEGAQIAKIIAETDNIKADTANKEGTGAMGAAQIASWLADAGAKKASESFTKSQEEYQKIMNYIAENSKDFQVSIFENQADLLEQQAYRTLYEGKQAKLQYDFDSETYKDRVQQVQKDLSLTIKQITKTEKETDQIEKAIEQAWTKLGIEEFLAQIADAKNEITWRMFEDGWKNQAEIFVKSIEAQGFFLSEELGTKERIAIMQAFTSLVSSATTFGAKK